MSEGARGVQGEVLHRINPSELPFPFFFFFVLGFATMRLAAAMPRATAKLFHNFAPLQTPFFAGQKGRPGKAGHNVALRHSADSAACVILEFTHFIYKLTKGFFTFLLLVMNPEKC